MKIALCCGTNGRAVVIGDVERMPAKGRAVRMKNARMVLYWSRECGGLLGLCARGPQDGTRITHAVPDLVETEWQEAIRIPDNIAELFDSWDSI